MESMLVSVITPCFNSAKTIEKTLECIERQTYSNLEYIIMDGGSTDGTLEIIEKHRSRLPEKLIVISQKDNGIYDAMNQGIQRASGELIGIVNSDDWYETDTVEQVVKHYRKRELEVVYGMQRTYLNGKEKSVLLFHHDFLPDQMITHPTCFVTKACYEQLGMFDCQYRSAADYDLMLRYFHSGKVTFTPVLHILSNFQLGGMSSSQVGVRENATIRHQYGYMSTKRFRFIMLKSRLYEWLKEKK